MLTHQDQGIQNQSLHGPSTTGDARVAQVLQDHREVLKLFDPSTSAWLTPEQVQMLFSPDQQKIDGLFFLCRVDQTEETVNHPLRGPSTRSTEQRFVRAVGPNLRQAVETLLPHLQEVGVPLETMKIAKRPAVLGMGEAVVATRTSSTFQILDTLEGEQSRRAVA